MELIWTDMQQGRDRLKSADVGILLLILNRQATDEGAVTIAIGEMAERLKYRSLNPVRDAIARLKRKKLITAEGQQGKPFAYSLREPPKPSFRRKLTLRGQK